MKWISNIIRYFKENLLAEQSRWLAWAPFLFGLGIAIYFCLPFEPNYWYSLGILELTIVLFFIFRYRGWHLWFMALLLIELGFVNIQMQTMYHSRRVNFLPKATQYLSGKIEEISYSNKGKMRLLLTDVSDYDKPLAGKYRFTMMSIPDEKPQINQCVELVGTFFAPEPIPVMNGYQLNRKYFYSEISGIGYSLSEVFVIDCPQKQTPTFKMRLNDLRTQIADNIAKILPADEAGVVDSVLIGEQSRIGKNVVEDYRDSGLAHFLSVSGLHLGAIAGLVFFVLRFLIALIPWLALRIDGKKVSAVGAIIFSALYLLVSGMAIPATRAFIMTAVVFVGVIFNRQAISMRMVCFAGLVLLIIQPEALVSVSFQMSFAAVVALIAFYERYAKTLNRWRTQGGFLNTVVFYLVGIVVCDLVASTATLPFAIYHFHRIAAYTSLANLTAGPLIGLYLMPMILVCLATLPMGLALYPIKLLGYGIGILNKITEFVANLPHSVVYIDTLPFWGFILIVVGGYWLCAWQRNWRIWGLVPIIIGIVPMFFPSMPDMVFAPHGNGVAVRDNRGDMVLLPLKTDGWIKSVWRENLHLIELNKEQKADLYDIFDGRTVNNDWLDLRCDENVCIYKNRVQIDKEVAVRIDNNEIELQNGGHIFISDTGVKMRPMQKLGVCRPWMVCYQKENK